MDRRTHRPDRHSLADAGSEKLVAALRERTRGPTAPDVVLSESTPPTAALLQQTRTIPIVFAVVSDPIGSGFVANLARPGGNVTGFLNIEGSLGGKWMELLKEVAPRVAWVAILYNPTTAPYAEVGMKPFKAAANSLEVEAITAPVRDTSELETIIGAHARAPTVA